MEERVGKVKWFQNEKGYGFIEEPVFGDVFVHYSQIQDEGFKSLQEKEEVTYQLVQGAKGWYATQVRRIEKRPSNR